MSALKITAVALLGFYLAACGGENVNETAQTKTSKKIDFDLKKATRSCSSCHGMRGLSIHNDWPNLAGQNSEYLVHHLTAFRSGKRQSPIMSQALLSDFSDQQLREIAQYYSELSAPVGKDHHELRELPGAQVRANCISCHGMSGNPVNSLWPKISGQKSGYLVKQLMNYKSGDRQHLLMQVIASELTEQQIIDVAEYYSKQ